MDRAKCDGKSGKATQDKLCQSKDAKVTVVYSRYVLNLREFIPFLNWIVRVDDGAYLRSLYNIFSDEIILQGLISISKAIKIACRVSVFLIGTRNVYMIVSIFLKVDPFPEYHKYPYASLHLQIISIWDMNALAKRIEVERCIASLCHQIRRHCYAAEYSAEH